MVVSGTSPFSSQAATEAKKNSSQHPKQKRQSPRAAKKARHLSMLMTAKKRPPASFVTTLEGTVATSAIIKSAKPDVLPSWKMNEDLFFLPKNRIFLLQGKQKKSHEINNTLVERKSFLRNKREPPSQNKQKLI
jgi:hypothetical protein